MRKFFLFFSVIIIPLSLFGWAQCRNTSGGSPEVPSAIYLGDTAEFGCDAWATDGGNWGRHQVVIHSSSDINNGTYGDLSDYNDVEYNIGISPRFTSSGTWYWGMQLNYGGDEGDWGWYCINNGSWYNMWGSPTSDLTVTVNELNDPSNLSITNNETNPNTQLDLSWNQDAQNHSVLLVRRKGNPVLWGPNQGDDYSDWQDLGNDTFVIRGSEASTSITDNNNGSGLEPNTMYYYKLYSENYQYYSSGITGEDQPLPVTLSTFTSQYLDGSAILNWVTQSESNNLGWNIYRSASSDLVQAQQLNFELIPGAGTCTEPTSYSYEDETELIPEATYWYWLESVSGSGETENYGPITLNIPEEQEIPELPQLTKLTENYPNPFNPQTTIEFTIKEGETGTLSIYNLKGQKIVSESFVAGTHEFKWIADNNASGVYLYKLETESYSKINKMVMLK